MADLGSSEDIFTKRNALDILRVLILRRQLRPQDVQELFSQTKKNISEAELKPLEDYKTGSLIGEFEELSMKAVHDLVSNWQDSKENKSVRRKLDRWRVFVLTIAAFSVLLISVASLVTRLYMVPSLSDFSLLAVLIVPMLMTLPMLMILRVLKPANSAPNLMDKFTTLRGELNEKAKGELAQVLNGIKTRYKLHDYPWRMGVPHYKEENPCRLLVERHDDYSQTNVFKEARAYIDTHDHGNIGVAGERGSGKTAMMKELQRYFASTSEKSKEGNGKPSIHTVWMSVSTRVEEKDFLVSVLAKLATSVGAKLTKKDDWPDEAPLRRFRKQKRRGRGNQALVLAGFVVLVTFALLISLPTDILRYLEDYLVVDLKTVLTAAGSIALFFLLHPVIKALGPRNPDIKSEKEGALVSASQDLLEELWYERTEIRSSEVGLRQFGTFLGTRVSMEKTREPFTLPHLVDIWEQYLKHLTADQGVFEKVVVFIDEIDKLKDTDRIKECLLILKALYHAKNVFFVVSISEDAYRLFEKRSLSTKGRNEFDSTLDKVLMVSRIEVRELRDLINSRMLCNAFSIPVMQLIWMVSKGNPRDAIRFARDIPQRKEDSGLRKIDEIALQLCTEMIDRTLYEYRKLSRYGNWRSNALDALRLKEANWSNMKLCKTLDCIICELTKELNPANGKVKEREDVVSKQRFLGELCYVRNILREYGENEEWRLRVVFDLYPGCQASMQNVQDRLSNGEAKKVCVGLAEYRSAIKDGEAILYQNKNRLACLCQNKNELAWAKLQDRELEDMIHGLLDNEGKSLSVDDIFNEMCVHVKKRVKIVGALEKLKERGFVECNGGTSEETATTSERSGGVRCWSAVDDKLGGEQASTEVA